LVGVIRIKKVIISSSSVVVRADVNSEKFQVAFIMIAIVLNKNMCFAVGDCW